MNSLKLCVIPMVFAAAQVLAQTQTQTREPDNPTQDPATKQSSDSRPSAPVADPSVNMGRNPAPSTQQTEGTLQEHRAPTATPPRDSSLSGPNTGRVDSKDGASGSSQSRTEAPPTQTQVAAEPAVVGTEVVTNSDQPLGSVVETVFDSQGQPAFVVISAGESMTALPYQTAKAMMNGDKMVIDRSRLSKAPKLGPGAWKDQQDDWKQQVTQYWERG
jgi:hypothetical protein